MTRSLPAFLFLAALLPAAARPAVADITPVGAFAKISGPKNAKDGYQLLLWRDGSVLLGRLNVWQAGDRQTGDFLHGVADAKGIYFTVGMAAGDAAPDAKPLELGVKGNLVNDRFEGFLWWDAARARVNDEDAAEKISLPRDKAIALPAFKDVTEWKSTFEPRP